MPAKKKTFNFEESLQELEGIVEKMESGDLSLEESLEVFERGVKLTRLCQKTLEEAEQKVKILMTENGEEVLQDFDSTGEDEA